MNRALFRDIQPHVVRTFFSFHQQNPKVYRLFSKYAYQLKRSGQTQYGAKAIMERIRWHLAVETTGEDFKLNNNFTSCYARLLMTRNQRFKSFFEVRSTR
jgi:hypothetical protein